MLPHELPHDVKGLRKLGNFKKILEMLGFDGDECTADHTKDEF